MAEKAAPETIAMSRPSIRAAEARRHCRRRRRFEEQLLLADRRHGLHAEHRRRAATLRLNACSSCSARMRRIRIWSDAIRGAGLRSSRIHIHTKPDPKHPKIVRVIEPERSRRRPATRARIRSIVDRRGSTSRRSAMPRQGPGGVFLMDAETFEPRGRWRSNGDRSTSPMTFGGTRLRHDGDERMGHARHLRERPHS
jgi:hypothetical protein